MIGLHRQSQRWKVVGDIESVLRVWSRTNVEAHKGAAAVCWTGTHVFSSSEHNQARLHQAITFKQRKYVLARGIQAPPFLERRVRHGGIVLNLIQEGGDDENVRRYPKGKRKVYS